MKRYVFPVLCILAFQVISGDAVAGQMPRSNSEKSHSTGIQVTRPGHSTVSKSRETVSAHRSHSAIGSSMENQKTAPSRTTIPSSSGKVASSYRSHNLSAVGAPTRSHKMSLKNTTVPRSNEKVPTSLPAPRASPKTSVSSTTRTISDQKPKPSFSRGSFPTSTKAPKSSPLEPPPAAATTTTNSTTTHNSTRTSTLVSATKTLTVSNGQTASAQVGWIVVGVGVGGSIAVEGNIIPVAGGTAGVIVTSRPGQDRLDPIDSSTIPTDTTTPTTTSTSSRSSSSSTSYSTSRSTSSSTARPTPYNIYPKLDSTRPEQSAFARGLERIAQPGSVRSITGVRDKLLLWVAALTPVQASELSRNPVVRGLNVDPSSPANLEGPSASDSESPSSNCSTEDCSHRKRDGFITMQQTILDELKMFSQAPGASLLELAGYAFDSVGGRGITVYVIDTGIIPNHPEFRNMQGSIRWLYLPGEPHIPGDENGHGTCVVSKVAGRTFGVAKNANIVVVKLPPALDGAYSASRVIAAWGVVANDIASNNMQRKAVVCNTLTVYPNRLTENERITYIASVGDIIDLDVVLVTASGNTIAESPGVWLDTYPALLANQLPIVVVGAVERSGRYAHYSQGLASQLTLSAAGRVWCASRDGSTVQRYGTSFAAPAVAGLAAYFMSLDQYRAQLLVPGFVARNVRNLIKSLAYARLPLQPTVVWNGIDSRQFQCPVRRDAGTSGCPPRNTTGLIVPPMVTPSSNPLPSIVTVGPLTITTLTSSSSSNSDSLSDSSITGFFTIMMTPTPTGSSVVVGGITVETSNPEVHTLISKILSVVNAADRTQV